MMRVILLAGSTALAACSPAVWRPLATTDAATDLTQVTRSDQDELDPAVAPDARTIAYEAAASPDAPPHIEVMSLEGVGSGRGGTIAYSSGGVTGIEPTWKPDGSALLFFSLGPRGRTLMSMIGHGAGTPPLVADAGEVGFGGEWPAVSPDGSTVAMSMANITVFHTGWRAARRFDAALTFAGPPGSGLSVSGPGTEPSWSPDGTKLAFVRLSGGHAHVFTARPDGSDAQQITEGPSDDEAPSWSPDGGRLVFCSTNAASTGIGRQADLFTVHPDGSGLVQLTEGDREACHPAWGRDGFIYFHANATDRFHIWRLHPS